MMKTLLSAVALAGALAAPGMGVAQDFPTKPVTIVVPYGPGASNDLFGRLVGDGLAKIWNQPVVVENMPGAGGSIGMANIAKAEPDGYRLVFTSSTFATNAAAQSNLPYDPATDLQPIAKVADGQLVLVAGKRLPLGSIEDVVREAKAQTVFYGSTGPASTPTFLARQFADVTGIELEGANYTGGSEAMVDLIGGRIDLYFGTVTTVLPAVQDGAVVPLAVLGKERAPELPDVPTIAEAGYPAAEATIWWGLFGPAGMPDAVVEKINADVATVMATPEAGEFLAKQGAAASTTSVAELETLVASELKLWKDLATKFHIVTN
jgi:tripartite-type tricarboxylate transporter receptor subunit TctC